MNVEQNVLRFHKCGNCVSECAHFELGVELGLTRNAKHTCSMAIYRCVNLCILIALM